MSTELNALYQEVILDHNRYPRNYHVIENASAKAEGYNPLCGDRVQVYLQINEEGIIEQASFLGTGCAISQASASIMTDLLKGRSLQEAQALFDQFHQLVTTAVTPVGVNQLNALAGVHAYPMRVKCATLAWHTLEAALQHSSTAVTTEE